MYYLRSQAKSSAQKFSVDIEKVKQDNRNIVKPTVESNTTPEKQVEQPKEEGCLIRSS